MSTRFLPFFVVLMLLAAYGFLKQLVIDPVNTILIIALSALVLYGLNRYLKTGRLLPASRPHKKQTDKTARSPKRTGSGLKKPFPFQVIEGQKGKPKAKDKENDRHMQQ